MKTTHTGHPEKSEKELTFCPGFWDFELRPREAVATLPWKPNTTTKHHVAVLLLISIMASLNHDYQQGGTARPRRWCKLVWQLHYSRRRGWRSERKPRRTYCTASSIYVHTVKSTAALHIGCFYHFGSLTWAPFEAINFKPQSLLPVLRLTFLPLLKEGRVEEKEKKAKSNLLFLYEIYSLGVRVNNDLIYQWLPCYLHCFRRVVSACDWAELFSRMERGAWGPGRLTSVWSKFMWNFPGPPGESLFMNCNKKSHFDGVTPVHRQEGGGGIWICLFARRRCSHRP